MAKKQYKERRNRLDYVQQEQKKSRGLNKIRQKRNVKVKQNKNKTKLESIKRVD